MAQDSTHSGWNQVDPRGARRSNDRVFPKMYAREFVVSVRRSALSNTSVDASFEKNEPS